MTKITPKDRELAMLDGEILDRMPIWQVCGIVAAKSLGYEWKDVRFDVEACTDISRRFAKQAGTDILGMTCVEMNAFMMDLGAEVKLPDDNYGNVVTHFYNDPEDLDRKELYDPSNQKEAPWLWKGNIGKSKLMAELENDYLVQQNSWGLMTTAGFLRNVETLLMDMVLEPELAHKVISKTKGLVDGIIRTGLENGCDTATLADPTSSGSLISADVFETFLSKDLKGMIRGFKDDYGAPTYIHVCGDTIPVAKPISEAGAAFFSFDFMNNPAEIRKLVGNKIILAGNLDPMDVVWKGTPEKVMAASKNFIDNIGGNAALATGCETPRDAPIENLQAMVKAVEKYTKR